MVRGSKRTCQLARAQTRFRKSYGRNQNAVVASAARRRESDAKFLGCLIQRINKVAFVEIESGFS